MDVTMNQFGIRRVLNSFFTILFLCALLVGCKDSATGSEELNKSTKTYDLVLATDGSTLGKVTTERITKEDDAYIDEGFFVTLSIDVSDFKAPYEIYVNNEDGYCGTWDVQSGEKAEMPCDYDHFMANTEELRVVSEDGDGVEAYASP
ncbi:hypothetical protein LQ318_13330 [Aliifodinibius salicampi]|uniref:Uncharacterized protein n=1 Tax=Fodinibius salicampi TaxID=1920655 RepID=A0ABT3Q192_9BACT|nr:hypothetical protein [Fodinibius salicampi]MCW9713887.1 hypothetical protein [Fodinibius salicampi]